MVAHGSDRHCLVRDNGSVTPTCICKEEKINKIDVHKQCPNTKTLLDDPKLIEDRFRTTYQTKAEVCLHCDICGLTNYNETIHVANKSSVVQSPDFFLVTM